MNSYYVRMINANSNDNHDYSIPSFTKTMNNKQ